MGSSGSSAPVSSSSLTPSSSATSSGSSGSSGSEIPSGSGSSSNCSPPAAPSALGAFGFCSGATPYVYLYWTDNSFDEYLFIVYRRLASEPDTSFVQIAWTGPNTSHFYDFGVSSGETYVYRVDAVSMCGTSASAPVTITVPTCSSSSGAPASSSSPLASSGSSGSSGGANSGSGFPSGS